MHNDEKLKKLLYGDDIETVKQGLIVLESLYSDVDAMFSFLGEQVPTSRSDWQNPYRQQARVAVGVGIIDPADYLDV